MCLVPFVFGPTSGGKRGLVGRLCPREGLHPDGRVEVIFDSWTEESVITEGPWGS